MNNLQTESTALAMDTTSGCTNSGCVLCEGTFRCNQKCVVLIAVCCFVVVAGLPERFTYYAFGTNSVPAPVDRQLDINTATAAELDALNGIGEKLAARILADRESRGPFTSLASLQRVKGIGPKILAKNQAHLRTDIEKPEAD